MKKLALALPFLALAFCQKGGQKRVIFLGDSITAMGGEPGGYLVRLREMLAGAGLATAFSIEGSGIGGNKIYDLHLRLEKDVLEKRPTHVVVFIGTNDVWHRRQLGTGTDTDKFALFYENIIRRLRGAGAEVALATPVAIGEQAHGQNPDDFTLDLFCEQIRSLARANGCQLVDLRKAFLEKNASGNPQSLAFGVLTTDGVHLNAAGNELVARAFFGLLTGG